MDDMVSRQAVIDTVHKIILGFFSDEDGAMNDTEKTLLSVNKAICNELAKLLSAQPEPPWIPCSERLPEDEYVLISKKPTKISGSKWSVAIAIRTADPRSRKIQWQDSGFGVIQDDKVLAWMPLPEPYAERRTDA